MMKPVSEPKFELSDILLALGILVSILTVALILVFAEGGTAASLGIAWGWIVEIAIWIYVFSYI